MSFRFSIHLPVRWKDIDAAGVLNNAVYLTLVEQARYGYFNELGLLTGAADFQFLLGETTARYLAPGRAGMLLDVRARTSRLGNKSFDQDYEVACGELLLARVSARLVWCDEALKSCPIPDAVRTKLAAFEGIPERS
ncbi:MAG: acyl-CoA thioesterase [Planctomycetes bacterium]|nr:acyl-CoA thioesterase [Planctomycetota bacterium]